MLDEAWLLVAAPGPGATASVLRTWGVECPQIHR